jgi:hypothetical protein
LKVTGAVTDSAAGKTVALTTGNGGNITLSSVISAPNDTLDLISAGSILQNGGSINVTTLTGSAVSSASLTQTTNLVGTLAAFTTDGGFALTDNESLKVTGAVTDSATGQTVALTTGNGGNITLSSLISAPNDTLDLISAGSILQNGGSINVTTLTGSAVSSASLTQTTNLVGTLDNFTAVGFTLDDSTALTVAAANIVNGGTSAAILDAGLLTVNGTVSATGNIYLESSDTLALGGITIAAGGSVGAGAAALASFQTDVFSNLGSVTGGTFELAPNTTGNSVTLGTTTASGLSLADLTNINAGTVRIGAVTQPDGTLVTTAGSIAIVAPGFTVAATTTVLELDGTGAVTQSSSLINVGTLTGTAASYTLMTAGNTIAALGSLTATTGSITIVDDVALAVQGNVTANSGNIFIEEAGSGAGNSTLNLNAGSLVVTGGTIGLVADTLTAAPVMVITAGASGLVEIAPFTAGTPVDLGGPVATAGTLLISPTLLADVTTASELRIGGYHDATNAGTNTVTAGSIDITGLVSLAAGAVPTLRLDTGGGAATIDEGAGGIVNVATFSASTNGGTGDIILDNASNVIAVLGNVTVGNGNFIVQDHTATALATLTVPGTSTVYAGNVTIANSGMVSIGGNLAATTGTLLVSALGSSSGINVSGAALIGAATTATISAGGAFTQTGGIIDAPTLAINAGNDGVNPLNPGQDFTQSGGTIAALSTAAGTGLTISATGSLSQSGASSAITANDDISATGTTGITLTSGSVIAAGNLTFSTQGGFTSGGTAAAGIAFTLQGIGGVGPTSLTQNGGLLGAGTTLLLTTTGTATQNSGTVAALDPKVSTAVMGTPQFHVFGNAISVIPGSILVSMINSGAVTPGAAPGLPTSTLTLPAVGSGPGGGPPGSGRPHHLTIDVTASDYDFNTTLSADWVEIDTPNNNTLEQPGGAVIADLLTGSAGGNAVFLQTGNQVTYLGGGGNGYTTGGNFQLQNAIALTVAGPIVVGTSLVVGHQTLELIAPALTFDQSGTAIPTVDGLSFLTNGSLQADAVSTVAGSVTTTTPGKILLQADTISALPATAGVIVITALDGMVEIAPLSSSSSMSVDLTPTTLAHNLSLTATLLQQIKTVGTTAGTAGTQTLVLGSLDDGVTSLATGITINTGMVLTGNDRNLQLNATGSVQAFANGVTVPALTGNAGEFILNGGANAVDELGNVASRITAGTTYQTSGFSALTTISSGQDFRLNDTSSLVVVGAVTANTGTLFPSGTIALTAPTIEIISGAATLTTGTITSAGSLLATAGPVVSGTLTPSEILLEADSLHIASATTTPIVSAPSGQVAIAPLTSGRPISIDGVATLGGATLSLGITDLALIDTLDGPLTALTPGPVGTQTLSLGSLNNGASIAAGGIDINAFLQLGAAASPTNKAANSLAMYSLGTIIENATGSIAVNTLIGTVTAGNIYLGGNNQFTNLGNLGTLDNVTTPGGSNANLSATAGNILIRNTQSLDTQSLTVVTTVAAASGAGNYVELDMLGATNGNLIVTNGGVVQGGSVYLRAGDNGIAGNVTIASGGSVIAQAASGEADLAAGVHYTAATSSTSPSNAYTQGATGGNVTIDGYVTGSTVGLYAFGNITEPGTIQAGRLTGVAGTIQAGLLTGFAGASASLPGLGSPTSNLIADLGPFNTNAGFVLHDGEALVVVGGVTDTSTSGITIDVAPKGSTVGTFADADLVLAAPVSAASGTVKLEATSNVYETNGDVGTPGTIINTGGTFTVPGGGVTAVTLVSQAGVIPDTETGGSTPGTIPASGTTFGPAIDWFGNVNQVGTLGNVTATGNFLLSNVQSLTVPGTVIAGTVPSGSIGSGPAYSVVAGPFGTTPTATPPPFAEIDVLGGNLTIPGIVHAGLDGTLAGNVTLRAGNSTTAGAVTIGGGVFAANGGAVNVSAGFDPTITPTTAAYFAACGGIACDITINGTIWGDRTGGTPALAGVVTLNAGSSIDETAATAMIGATTLTGGALGHAALLGGGNPTLNRVVTLGTFDTNGGGYNDPLGFQLRDGQALLVGGPVTDHGTTSSLVSIAVAPPGTVALGYGAADLVLASGGTVTANPNIGTVKLQATGNVSETPGGGIVVAGTLVAQAGAIPDTESAGNLPGTISATPILSTGSITLNNLNQIANLGSVSGVGVSAEGNIALTNVPSLTVNGTVVSANGAIIITNTGDVTNNSVVNSMSSSATITSQGSITNNDVVEAAIDAILSAVTNITNNGFVSAGHDAILGAGANIVNNNLGTLNSGTVSAGHNALLTATADDIDNNATALITAGNIATLTAGGSINDEAHAVIIAAGTFLTGAPNVVLFAKGGSIDEVATGTISATNTLTGDIILTAGTVNTAGTSSITADGLITAAGTGTVGTPSVSLIANGGTIEQAFGGTILATNPVSGDIALSASTSITTNGAITAAGTVVGAPSVLLTALGGSIDQASTGTISAPNTVAGDIILTAGTVNTAGTSSITADGLITAAGTGTAGTPSVSLIANGGTIEQALGGTISATNTVAGDIALSASTSITTNGLITAAGTVAGAPSVLLTALNGTIDQAPGGIIAATDTTASSVSLSATMGIAFGGQIFAGASVYPSSAIIPTGTVALNTTGGDITETASGSPLGSPPTGVVAAGTLTASAGGNVFLNSAATASGTSALTGPGNQVINLGTSNAGSPTATTGEFWLVNQATLAPALNVIGPVIAMGTVIINEISPTGNVTNNSVIQSVSSDVTILATGSITNNGLVEAFRDAILGAGTSIFNDNLGTLNSGTVSAGHDALLTASTGDIDNSASAINAIALITAGNIATLTAGGSINDGTLAVITAAGNTAAAGPTVMLIAQGGTIDEAATGTISATNTLTGDILLTAGTIHTAGTSNITADGLITAAGAGTAGTVSVSLIANGGTIEQAATGTILATNPVAGDIALSASTSITADGTITAAGAGIVGTPSVSLIANGGTIEQAATGTIQATNTVSGDIALSASTSIVTNGAITAAGTVAGAPSVLLTALNGSIDQAPGGIIAATDTIASTISLSATTGIAFGGQIFAGATTYPPSSTAIPTGNVILTTTSNDITETASGPPPASTPPGAVAPPTGVVAAGTLTASAGGNVYLNSAATASGNSAATGPGNQVVVLGSSNAGSPTATIGEFWLTDQRALTMTGTISAPLMVINTGTSALTVDNTTIDTGGTTAPNHLTIVRNDVPSAPVTILGPPPPPITPPSGLLGAYFTSGTFTQTGATQVNLLGTGPASVVSISVMNGGNITLDPSGGINGPGTNGAGTWLILDLLAGGSHVTGNVNVGQLTVELPPNVGNNTSPFSVTLTGSVDGQFGQLAASNGSVIPTRGITLRINNCPIGSVNCVLLSGALVPITNPLQNLTLGILVAPDDEGDLLLPLVSDEDFLSCLLRSNGSDPNDCN